MFAAFNRFRRRVAVLMVLSLVASVLVAVPVSAADDPEPSFTATFDACAWAPDSGFSDVPAGYVNAGDIDCIAYYGITKGTSATTYSPLASVTREHMALFLMRLAGLVGIQVPPAGDTGFSDTGDLSDESQAAISQLAQLDVTQGTSDTTYSPADSVTRGQMALFIQRLMNKMDPMTDGTNDYGSTPSDVANNTADEDVGSPFTDLGSVTKSAYDAINELYELGVASGISDTAYGPAALISRASMAGFMAAVLDHSNIRPAGLSIQASQTSGFGAVDGTVVVSYRDDSFAPVADQVVDTFDSDEVSGGLDDDGACVSADLDDGDCIWSSSDDITDDSGNIFYDGGAEKGATHVYYAWIGEEDGDTFDADDGDEVTVSVSSSNDELSLKVTSSVSDDATADTVDLGATSSVTFTVQLVDELLGAGDDVARSGVEITVGISESSSGSVDFASTNVATLTTDEDGQATYTVEGPEDDADVDTQERTDTVTFKSDGLVDETGKAIWVEAVPVTTKAAGTAPAYVVLDDGDATVSASVAFYDQYGDTIRGIVGQKAGIDFTVGAGSADAATPNVNRNGWASRSLKLTNQIAGVPVTVEYTAEVAGDGITLTLADPADATTELVNTADEDDIGRIGVHTFYADDNMFTTEVGGSGADAANADKLYSYDADDTFTADGETITIDDFEDLLAQPDSGANAGVVNVVIYSEDGLSIFTVTAASS